MAKKKVVGYGMLALGIVKLAFSLAVHSPGHVVATIEVVEALLLMSAGVVLYATDAHKIVLSISQSLYKNVELKVLDAFNYCVANLTIAFCQRFRKTHTGVLSYDMVAVLIGAALLMALLFLLGGRSQ